MKKFSLYGALVVALLLGAYGLWTTTQNTPKTPAPATPPPARELIAKESTLFSTPSEKAGVLTPAQTFLQPTAKTEAKQVPMIQDQMFVRGFANLQAKELPKEIKNGIVESYTFTNTKAPKEIYNEITPSIGNYAKFEFPTPDKVYSFEGTVYRSHAGVISIVGKTNESENRNVIITLSTEGSYGVLEENQYKHIIASTETPNVWSYDLVDATKVTLMEADNEMVEQLRAKSGFSNKSTGWENAEMENDDAFSSIDLLILFDTNALTYANNKGGIQVFAQARVDAINECAKNCGVNAVFNLVAARTLNYTSPGNLTEALTAISNLNGQTGSQYNNVETIANEVGADVICLLAQPGNPTVAGVGWGARNYPNDLDVRLSRSVTLTDYAETNYTMHHEMGHTMGAGHSDLQVLSPGPQMFSYSAGWYGTTNAVCTVMSYNDRNNTGNRVPRINYFSTPLKTYNNEVTGNATTQDNVRTINITAPDVQNYRPSMLPSIDVTPTLQVDANAGTCKITVKNTSQGAAITWTAKCGAAWLTSATPTTGTLKVGETTEVEVAYRLNDTNAERKGTVSFSIAGSEMVVACTIIQKAPEPIMAVSTNNLGNVTSAPGTKTFSVSNVGTGVIRLTLTSDVDWVRAASNITAIPGPDGTATVTVQYERNTSGVQREATITVSSTTPNTQNAPQEVILTQSETAPTLAVDPTKIEVNPNPQTVEVNISNTGDPKLEWNIDATTLPNWLTLTEYTGTLEARSSRKVEFTFAENPQGGIRSCTILVTSPTEGVDYAPQTIEISQYNNCPILTVSTNALTVPYTMGTKTFEIHNIGTRDLDWTIDLPENNFVTITPMGGFLASNAKTTVSVNYPENMNIDPRSMTFSVTSNTKDVVGSPKVITFTQDPPKPELTLSANSMNVSEVAGDYNFTISNTREGNMNWTIENNNSWITVTPKSGSSYVGNSSDVTFSVNSNPTFKTRTGIITVIARGVENSPQILTVTQNPGTAILEITPVVIQSPSYTETHQVVVSNSGTAPMNLTTLIPSNVNWLSVAPSNFTVNGGESVSLNIYAFENTQDVPVTSSITVKSLTPEAQGAPQTITITKSERISTPILAVSENAFDVTASEGSVTLTLSNIGELPMDWTLNTSEGLSASPNTGNLVAQGSQEVTLQYTANSQVELRTLIAEITTTTPDAQNVPQEITISQSGTDLDPWDPNDDTVNGATELVCADTVQTQSGHAIAHSKDKEDWFKIPVTQGSSYLIKFIATPNDAPTLTLTLMDENYSTIQKMNMDKTKTSQSLLFIANVDKTIYVQAKGKNEGSYAVQYQTIVLSANDNTFGVSAEPISVEDLFFTFTDTDNVYFARKPSAAGIYQDPAKGKIKKSSIKVYNFEKNGNEINVYNNGNHALFNTKVYNKSVKSGVYTYDFLKDTSFEKGQLPFLDIAVTVTTKDAYNEMTHPFGKQMINVNRTLHVIPPKIEYINDSALISDTVSIDSTWVEFRIYGKHFGKAKPKAWIEYKSAGKILKAAFKVGVVNTANGAKDPITKSPYTNSKTAESYIQLKYPTRWNKEIPASDDGKYYIVISTGKRMCAYPLEIK